MKYWMPVLVLAVATSAQSQTFTNLDFEAAVTVPNSPPFGFLDWSLAAPGWNHSPGADTSSVYYGTTHVGITQWFLLVDSITQPNGPLAGNYSMRFASGHESANPSSPWVNAYLSQVGVIPTEARSLTFLANGPVAVSINDAAASLVSLGGSRFAVDVSLHSGTATEVRFINTSMQLFDAVSLDGIEFSASPVPEPAAWLLLCIGAAGASVFRRHCKVDAGQGKHGDV